VVRTTPHLATGTRPLLQRLRHALPQGRTLPPEAWERRHHALLFFLWLQAAGLGVYTLLRGYGLADTALHIGGVVVCAVLGTVGTGRRWRATWVSVGCMTAGAVAVHASGGAIEAHFYFFVMIVVLTLYEDWVPFLVAIAYVVLHHGIVGAIDPSAVYDHKGAEQHPWRWALVHGAFVTAAGVGALVAWRLNEETRLKAFGDLEERERAVSLLEATLQSTADGILVVDGEGAMVSYNDEFVRMWRIPDHVMDTGDDEQALWYVVDQLADQESFVEKVRELYEQPDAESYDVLEFKDGRVFERYSRPQRVGGESVGRVWSFRDITERRRFESELQHLADHDALTGLLNRRRFEEELEREVALASRYGEAGAALVLDLDNFKYVNDTMGHQAGDQLILDVAGALRRRLRETDAMARLGGDEFAVILPRTDDAGAHQVARELLQAVREHEGLVAGRTVRVTTSIGVATFGAERVTGQEVLATADIAMYEAKDAGRDRVCALDDTSGGEARQRARTSWIERIREALDEDRFVLQAQPILNLATDEVSQHELLLRMVSDTGEIVPPAAFLSTAERFGLVQSIDRWVVQRAIRLMDQQLRQGRRLRLEVNISGNSVDDRELRTLIQEELTASAVDPDDLILEITETAVISNMDDARRFAESLSRLGCRFALDDFGTGFGSYYYLKHLPLHYIKIDGDFIRNLAESPTDQLMVRAMVQVAQGLGMKTIAEFVENAETVEFLRAYGVDFAQGYHVGRPQPIEELWPVDADDEPGEGKPAPVRVRASRP
jgi:diguanylate cyclase (GGDEF)-like protein